MAGKFARRKIVMAGCMDRFDSTDPDNIQEISERDQLWASLRGLQAEIQRLAEGELDGSARQQQLIVLLARIVAAEMSFRAKDAGNA